MVGVLELVLESSSIDVEVPIDDEVLSSVLSSTVFGVVGDDGDEDDEADVAAVEGADVEGADVDGADVDGADVDAADVDGAEVEGAEVDGSTDELVDALLALAVVPVVSTLGTKAGGGSVLTECAAAIATPPSATIAPAPIAMVIIRLAIPSLLAPSLPMRCVPVLVRRVLMASSSMGRHRCTTGDRY